MPCHIRSVLLLQALLFASSTLAEELRADDVPSACTTICQPIVQLTSTCDVDPGKVEGQDDTSDVAEADEAVEASCICTNQSFDVASIAALCASCITQNANGAVDDMDKIMSACSFTSTSYAAYATALVAQVTVSATKPATTGPGAGATLSTSPGQATQTAASTGLGNNMGVPGLFLIGVALGAYGVGMF